MIDSIQVLLDNYDMAAGDAPDPDDVWTIEFNFTPPKAERYTLLMKGECTKNEVARELRLLADTMDYGIQGTRQ